MRAGRIEECLLPRFEVFGRKGPNCAESLLSGAWDPRFGDEVALLECLGLSCMMSMMWSRISGGRYGFDVAVSVQNLKPPFLALVHCPSVTFDVYQLAYGQAVAPFGGSAREWVWKGVLDAGGNGDSAFDGTHAK